MNRSFYGNIKKLDGKGNIIKVWKGWVANHPGELYFDSALEYVVYNYLKDNNINFEYQPDSLTLIDPIKTLEIKDIKRKGVKSTVIKETPQRSISYTPDFLLTDSNVYLETKGYLKEDSFRLRWRLFKSLEFKGFIIRNLLDLKITLKHLEDGDI